jgi:hypothetical protein
MAKAHSSVTPSSILQLQASPQPMTLLTLELRRRLEQFRLLAARGAALSPSAQRMNMNSRGCQPTESPSRIVPDPEGVEPSPVKSPVIHAAPSGPDCFRGLSRGCQPAEPQSNTISTLKGSNHEHRFYACRTNSLCDHIVRPLQGREYLRLRSVGFTHGYSCCSPSANPAAVRSIWPCFALRFGRLKSRTN